MDGLDWWMDGVATQVNMDAFVGKTLPQVNHVAHVGHRNDFLLLNSFADCWNQLVEVFRASPSTFASAMILRASSA